MHRLKAWMKDKGETQQSVASRLGVRQSTVSDWINGNNWPSVEKLKQLSEWTGLTINELVESAPVLESDPDTEPSARQKAEPTMTGTHG